MIISDLKQLEANLWELPKTGEMRVPGRIYANENILGQIFHDNALQQVVNVASLPGIQKYSLAMPDIHWGYGFPIGGVAAMDAEEGVISPGGVGYDINCGIRLIATNIEYNQIKSLIPTLTEAVFKTIPTGIGSKNAINDLSQKELRHVMQKGSKWAVENGFGKESDLVATEEFGCLQPADPQFVSDRAQKRAFNQLGTLGSGNHFIELGTVREVFDPTAALKLGLSKNQFIIIIHTGSRGLGHQICDDYVHRMLQERQKLNFPLPDAQLISAYISSKLGKEYFNAMACAANFAWANRQIIMSLVEKTICKTMKISPQSLGFNLIYDVCHNIAKFEDHEVDGKMKHVCVHRKGATRAFGPGHPTLADRFAETGQPVIIPGDMGTKSYLCVGTTKAMQETFGSSCHGAGRILSRSKALKIARADEIIKDLKEKNITLRADSKKTIVEEMSAAYKNVSEVVQTIHDAGIVKKVVQTAPLGVVKG
jgi:tRNA-splicing ligase RtcB